VRPHLNPSLYLPSTNYYVDPAAPRRTTRATCSGQSSGRSHPWFCIRTNNARRSPETVESLFIAWRLTGDARYRAYAWGIFEAIERHCRLPAGGYATVLDVDTVPVRHDDKQETFYLVCLCYLFSVVWFSNVITGSQSETLKYLFLTFADGAVMPLDGTSYSVFYSELEVEAHAW
jgi:hypothetical protein